MILSKVNPNPQAVAYTGCQAMWSARHTGDITCKHELTFGSLGPEDEWRWHLARNSSTSSVMAARTRGSFVCGVATKLSDSRSQRRRRRTKLSSETSFQVRLGGLNREPFEFSHLLFICCGCLMLKIFEGRRANKGSQEDQRKGQNRNKKVLCIIIVLLDVLIEQEALHTAPLYERVN